MLAACRSSWSESSQVGSVIMKWKKETSQSVKSMIDMEIILITLDHAVSGSIY